MKYFLILGTALFLSCSGESGDGDIPQIEASTEGTGETETTTPTGDDITGTWSMDSSVFINDGVEDTYTPPIIPTTWTFHADGKYEVKNNMTLSGTYSKNGNALATTLMGMTTDYEILTFEDGQLLITSTILDTETSSMKTKACLTRISN